MAPTTYSAASGTSDKDLDSARRINALRNEFDAFFEHIKFALLIPFSWCLTICHFIIVLNWRILTLPLRIAINFYERQIRRRFPWLPSIWGTLALIFPEGIKLPTFTSLTAGPYKGKGPTGSDLPTLDMSADLDAIINGDANGNTNGVNGGGGGGGGSSGIENSRSKLESALKRIPSINPSDLDAGLADVKVRGPSN